MATTDLLTWGVGLFLALMTLLFIVRIVLTWYPQVDSTKLPFSLVVWPTEPLLVPVRSLVPPSAASIFPRSFGSGLSPFCAN